MTKTAEQRYYRNLLSINTGDIVEWRIIPGLGKPQKGVVIRTCVKTGAESDHIPFCLVQNLRNMVTYSVSYDNPTLKLETET